MPWSDPVVFLSLLLWFFIQFCSINSPVSEAVKVTIVQQYSGIAVLLAVVSYLESAAAAAAAVGGPMEMASSPVL